MAAATLHARLRLPAASCESVVWKFVSSNHIYAFFPEL
jgi:hypothetical protein